RSAAGAPARPWSGSRCGRSWWWRWPMTRWRATGSGTPPSSNDGGRTGIPAPAAISNWSSRSGSMSTRCLPVTSNVVPVTVRATYRLLAVLVLTSLLLTGCIFDRRSDDSAPDGPSTIAWRDCQELVEEMLGDLLPEGMLEQLTADLTYECGRAEVAQDRHEPHPRQTSEIALTRVRYVQHANRSG